MQQLTAQVAQLTKEKERLLATIESQRLMKQQLSLGATNARASPTSAAAGHASGTGCKRPFCNACRMLVMDRMCGFLPFYPHPAVHERHATLFATKVKEQYLMKDQKARQRKADGAWCVHCRSESGVSRTKKDRFTLMWDDAIVRQRVSTDWYKDVRVIDEELIERARQLLEVGEGGNGLVIRGLCDQIHEPVILHTGPPS